MLLATVQQSDTAAARASLRAQIARLERELSSTLAETWPPINVSRPVAHHGPRLLDLRELEQTRDALAHRLAATHQRVAEQRAAQDAARTKLAAMLANPAAHKYETVSNHDLGLPGCTTYSVRPRLLGSWWRVKVSSGCP